MKSRNKIILLVIILFPALIYFLFELTQANFKKMAYFGPKSVAANGDTNYYRVPDISFRDNLKAHILTETKEENGVTGTVRTKTFHADLVSIDTIRYPVYLIFFIDHSLRKDGYKLAGIYDYLKYKTKEFDDIPIFVVSDFLTALTNDTNESNALLRGDFDSLQIKLPNFHPLMLPDIKNSKEFLANTYFKQKPFYVMDHFAVLVDKQRHIRGYYDPGFNAEVKRMIQEFKHLKIRDGYAQTQEQNNIEKKK
jgi:hypothetical protein